MNRLCVSFCFFCMAFTAFSFKESIVHTKPIKKIVDINSVFNHIDDILYNQPDSALTYLLLIEDSLKSKSSKGHWHYYCGIVYDLQGKSYEAIQEQKKALRIFSVLNNVMAVQAVYNELGNIFLKQNDCYASINYFTENYNYLKNIRSNKQLKNPILLAEVANKLANIYNQIEQYEKASRFYREAFQISNNQENKYFHLISYIEWCGTLNQLGQYPKVISLLEKIRKNEKAIPTPIHKKLLFYLSYAYINSYQLKAADRLLVMLFLNNNYALNEHETIDLELKKSRWFFLNNEIENAIQSAFVVYNRTQLLPKFRQKAALILMRSYLALKKYKEASFYLKQFHVANYEINDEKIEDLIQFWDSKEKYDERIYRENLIKEQSTSIQRNAEILHKKEIDFRNKELIFLLFILLLSIISLAIILIVLKRIKLKNVQLNFSLKEKEVLLKEVHHRVKNNFQIISSLLNLQSNLETEDKKAYKLLKEAQNRIYSMSLVHQKIYSSNSLEFVDMQSYFDDLTKALSDTFLEEKEHLDTTINCFDIQFSLEKVIPLGLIANEAISNAMKYGKSSNNKLQIEIQLFAENGFYKLEISDKGKGYPEDLNIENLNSLGLELISILTEQLNGTWEHKNQGGAYICIKFPKNE